ncbi:MAG: response regulator [Archangiaceae bacterium]|nr:response regulator [Archangiaceae bacterium]
MTSDALLKVLVVEDDAVDRLAIRRAIGKRAEVDDAHDGPSALNLLAAHRYDVALLDYFLPGDTGLAVFSKLREQQPDLPVIFLSGMGSEEVVLDAMKAGASDYLSKSAVEERDRLWRSVRSVIETSRLRREAERNRARLQLAVEAAGAGTWELDLSWGQFRGDARFRELFGLDEQETWTADQVRARLTPDGIARLDEALASNTVAVQLQLLGEPSRWVDLRGRHEPDARRVFGTAIDLTQVKNEEARASSLRERLMGIASHDLKNPLSAVLQASALLAQSPRLETREKRYVNHIRTSAERMTHLIVQLLDLTRVRLGGGLPLEKKKTRLDDAVRQVADELKMANPERTMALQLDELELDGDPDRLQQVASNLLGNALKHSPPDTSVAVNLRREGSAVVLEVTNLGNPIPPDKQATIFEPFVQYGENRPRDGLGLGLYISREIVRAHGGTLQVTSSPDGGTAFTARLPLPQ